MDWVVAWAAFGVGLTVGALIMRRPAWWRGPIPMVLHCPACGLQHVDRPVPGWDNPTHRSHLCGGCGCIWRPCDLPTVGVEAIGTRGKADNWPAHAWRPLEIARHGTPYPIVGIDPDGNVLVRPSGGNYHGQPVDMPAWRCIGCKAVTESMVEPERCAACLGRAFARCAD